MLTRFKSELTTNQFKLRFLRLVQSLRRWMPAPVRTSVGHPFIKHSLKQIVTEIVMPLTHLEGFRFALGIHEMCEEK